MNKLPALAVLAFSITLAVLIGQRLSDQAMAVIVGSVIGVAASVPMTALVLWLTLRQRDLIRQTMTTRAEPTPREEASRIVVIQPQPYAPPPYPQTQQHTYLTPPPLMPSYSSPSREFKIVGVEDLDHEDRNALV
jgi:hypothetical protein